MRVRVTPDITQPLGCERVVVLDKDKEGWVSFKYQPNLLLVWLPLLC